MISKFTNKIRHLNGIFVILIILTFLLQACSQLDIDPKRTTHEDIVKDNIETGRPIILLFLMRTMTLLLKMVFGDDAAEPLCQLIA